MARRFWTAEEDAQLAKLYPKMSTAKVAAKLGHSLSSTYQRAYRLGLAKNEAYLASPDACRLRRGDNVGAAYRFPKGHTPVNKGLRRPGWGPGRMKETQFQKGVLQGRAALVVKPIGHERMSKDGYLERKINNDLPFQRRWRAVHLIVWESAHGPLAPGHAVVFENGDKTDIRPDNLKCITRKELMARNTVHNLPAPLPQVVQLIGALKRKINRRTRNDEEQDRGSAQPPVRNAGSAGGQGSADGDPTREGDRGRSARDRGLGEGGGSVPRRDKPARRDGVHRAPRAGGRITTSARRSKRAHALVVERSVAAGCAT